MLKKKNVFVGLLLLFSLVLILGACEPDRGIDETDSVANNSSDDGEVGLPEKPEELVVWINDEDIIAEATQKLFDRYTEETGITIVTERVAQPDQVQDLALAGPIGDGPDLFYQPQDTLGDIVAQGLAVPFEYSSEDLNGFSEVAIDAFTYEGEMYGAPAAIETYFAFYNKSLLDEAPETIEETFEMAQAMTNTSNDEYGFLLDPSFYYLYTFINGYGGYVFGEENGVYNVADIGLNNEGAIEGLTKFQEFVLEGLIPRSATTDVVEGLFTEGKVGMIISGPWNLPIFGDALGDDLGTAPIPKMNGEGTPSFVGVKSWLTSYYSENVEWAQDLAKFLTSEESLQTYYEVTGELPPRENLLDQINDPIYQGYTEQINYGTPMPNIPEMAAVWDMDDAIELIMSGADVKEMLDEIVGTIEEKIAISQN